MRRLALLTTTLLSVSSLAYAQTAPDAGRTLQQLAPPLELPTESAPVEAIPQQQPPAPSDNQTQVLLHTITLEGNSLYGEEELRAVLGDVTEKTYDLAGLRALAAHLSDFYHEAGYPFARAFLPPQELTEGTLKIHIVEGRYGQVKADGNGDESTQENAQEFLSPLQTGEVIQSDDLERTTLILSDQPGIKAAPIIRPGQEIGTGDLMVPVSRTPALSGEIGADNEGNRYSGEYRGKLDLQYDSPFLFGDQIQLKSLGTDEAMWLGSLFYSLPLGSSGLRGQVGYYQTDYSLGKQFKDLDASGYAKVSSVGVSYPLIRSQKENLAASLTFQHKDLRDEMKAVDSNDSKTSDSAPLSLQFDRRDRLFGGGITYGTASWTYGNLSLDKTLRDTDASSAQTEGRYNKLNLDMARLQKLPEDFTFFARFSGQWSAKNLDSSEGFGLGGPNGIRAYPIGEGYGDRGWFAQIETRYAVGPVEPFAFYDVGRVTINADTWDDGKNDRTLAGPGFGVRSNYEGWNLEATLAWRTVGGEPQSDTADRTPRGWVAASYKF